MALDGPQTVTVAQEAMSPFARLSMSNFLYMVEYGYWLPRPRELSARLNLLFVFDLATWAFLGAALAAVTAAEAGLYLGSRGSGKFVWVCK